MRKVTDAIDLLALDARLAGEIAPPRRLLVAILVVHVANRRNSALIASSPARRRPGGRRTALSAAPPPFGSLGSARGRSARTRPPGRRVGVARTHGAAALHAPRDTSAKTASPLPLPAHHLVQRLLYHPINHRWDAQLPHPASRLRDLYSLHRLWLIPVAQQRFLDPLPLYR